MPLTYTSSHPGPPPQDLHPSRPLREQPLPFLQSPTHARSKSGPPPTALSFHPPSSAGKVIPRRASTSTALAPVSPTSTPIMSLVAGYSPHPPAPRASGSSFVKPVALYPHEHLQRKRLASRLSTCTESYATYLSALALTYQQQQQLAQQRKSLLSDPTYARSSHANAGATSLPVLYHTPISPQKGASGIEAFSPSVDSLLPLRPAEMSDMGSQTGSSGCSTDTTCMDHCSPVLARSLATLLSDVIPESDSQHGSVFSAESEPLKASRIFVEDVPSSASSSPSSSPSPSRRRRQQDQGQSVTMMTPLSTTGVAGQSLPPEQQRRVRSPQKRRGLLNTDSLVFTQTRLLEDRSLAPFSPATSTSSSFSSERHRRVRTPGPKRQYREPTSALNPDAGPNSSQAIALGSIRYIRFIWLPLLPLLLLAVCGQTSAKFESSVRYNA